MSKLLSGKEALIALANGEDVEILFKENPKSGWYSVQTTKLQSIDKILNHGNEFRLKPRTITINGIEMPAPFEPKEGDDCRCYYINTALKHGFDWYHSTHHESNRVAWRTEEEIKQVVSALRSVFKPQ